MGNLEQLDSTTVRLRLITLNTWKGDGDYSRRLLLMASQLSSLEPDIICLQESLRSWDEELDTARYLADELRMQHLYAPSRWKVRAVNGRMVQCHSGLAILSQTKLQHHRVDALLSHKLDADRIGLSAETIVGNIPVFITNLHLTHIKDQDSFRTQQLIHLIETIQKDRAQPILWFGCGDYNRSFDQTALQQIGQQTGLTLEDCYLCGGGPLPGYTFPDHENTQHSRRIDYILSLSKTDNPDVICQSGQIVLNRHDSDKNYPSDHFGVMCDFLLKRK